MLLHLVAEIDPNTPILFLNTGKLFGETLRYRDRLQDVLGLGDMRSLAPDPADRAAPRSRRHAVVAGHRRLLQFPQGDAAQARAGAVRGADHRPQALPDHGARRDAAGRVSSKAASASIRWPIGRLPSSKPTSTKHDLPRHPLVEDGYPSIGCMPCTRRVAAGEDYRAGRWSGLDKDECGIHIGVDGEGI